MAQVDLVTADIRRSPTGRLSIAVSGVDVGEAHDLVDAVSALCRYAVTHAIVLSVSVSMRSGSRWMQIDSDGIVTPTTAPASRTHDSTFQPTPIDRTSSVEEQTGLEWAERYILDPAAEQPSARPERRRPLFWRR